MIHEGHNSLVCVIPHECYDLSLRLAHTRCLFWWSSWAWSHVSNASPHRLIQHCYEQCKCFHVIFPKIAGRRLRWIAMCAGQLAKWVLIIIHSNMWFICMLYQPNWQWGLFRHKLKKKHNRFCKHYINTRRVITWQYVCGVKVWRTLTLNSSAVAPGRGFNVPRLFCETPTQIHYQNSIDLNIGIGCFKHN